VTELLSEHGIPCVEEARLDEPGDDQAAGDAAPVARYANEAQTLQFVVFESPELDVVLLQGEGGAAVPILGKMLERTGFVPQSHLWNAAVSVAEPGASRALKTLAHMAVEWDEEWTDMFVLHLASPDAIARHEAVAALSIAAMVAREVEPALMLLDEAIQRERFPKLRETMGEARRLLEAYSGMPVEPD
jgi:hypothetical protein